MVFSVILIFCFLFVAFFVKKHAKVVCISLAALFVVGFILTSIIVPSSGTSVLSKKYSMVKYNSVYYEYKNGYYNFKVQEIKTDPETGKASAGKIETLKVKKSDAEIIEENKYIIELKKKEYSESDNIFSLVLYYLYFWPYNNYNAHYTIYIKT